MVVNVQSDSIFVSFFLSCWSLFSQCPLTFQLLFPPTLFLLPYLFYNFYLHPLSSLPGPLSARLGLPFWRFWHAYKEDYVWELRAVHEKLGDTVRIGPNHVSFTSPEAVQTIYAHGGKFHKTPFYRAFQVLKTKPSLFSDIDPHSHSSRRRAIAHVYSMNSLVELESCVDPCVDLLLKRLDEQVSTAPPALAGEKRGAQKAVVDLTKWLHFFAMDAVGELAFGRSFDLLSTGVDSTRFLQGVTNLSLFGSIAGCLPPLASLINWGLPRLSGQPGGEVIGTRTSERIAQRYADVSEGKEARPDMLTKFMAAKYPGSSQVYSQQDVLFTATSVVAAGSDTTSLALSGFFYYLLKHSQVYTRLQSEIDEAVESGQLSFPVRYAQGVKLDYLQACIKETLRLHPPISMDLPRYVPAGGASISGRFYPAGTTVGVSPYVFHRTTSAFGEDATSYRPERWLNLSEEKRREMERNNLSFGGGARQCIGKNISLMEVSKVLPALLTRYSFANTPRATPGAPHASPVGRGSDGVKKREEPWTVGSAWFLDANDFWCDVTLRKPEELEL